MKLDMEEKHKRFWDGNKNKAIRYYFYVNKGLNLLNEARYLIMAILAIYTILKIKNPLFMPLMFFGSLPVLCISGYISVHHMSKVMDFLNVHFGTHFSRYSVELQERTLDVLIRLEEKLAHGDMDSSGDNINSEHRSLLENDKLQDCSR